MTKKCAFEGCVNEIQVWQTYCPKHYELFIKGQIGEEPPEIPDLKVSLPKQIIERDVNKEIKEDKVGDKVEQPKEKVTNQEDDTDYEEKQIRKDCLKYALDFLMEVEDLNKPYEELIGQVATLVEDFYNIVSKKYQK